MKKSTLNITAGTDVVLNDTLTFQGEVFDPSLSVNVEANLISGLGKRSALSFEIEDTHMIIDVPWEEGRLTGCYGLEVRGVTNGRKWTTYSDSLLRYTKATEDGASSVTDEGDVYDITQTVAYRYTISPIEEITADTDGLTGTPSVSVDYDGKDIAFHFDGIKGEKGDAFTYDDFTPEELESLRGPQGPKGSDGVVLDPEAVTIFDSIDDLEWKTAEEKHEMIPDGAVVEEIGKNIHDAIYEVSEDTENVDLTGQFEFTDGKGVNEGGDLSGTNSNFAYSNIVVLPLNTKQLKIRIPRRSSTNQTIGMAFYSSGGGYGTTDCVGGKKTTYTSYVTSLNTELYTLNIPTGATHLATSWFSTTAISSGTGTLSPFSCVAVVYVEKVKFAPRSLSSDVDDLENGMDEVQTILPTVYYDITQSVTPGNYYVEPDGTRRGHSAYSQYSINNKGYSKIRAYLNVYHTAIPAVVPIAFYDSDGTFLSDASTPAETEDVGFKWYDVPVPSKVAKIRITHRTNKGVPYAYAYGVMNAVQQALSNIDTLKDRADYDASVSGMEAIYNRRAGMKSQSSSFDATVFSPFVKQPEITGKRVCAKCVMPRVALDMQGGALYGNLFVCANTTGDVSFIDIRECRRLQFTKRMIYEPRSHNNAAFFGTEFYDENDTYPIIYFSASDAAIHGYRITLVNGVYGMTLVQTINMPSTAQSGYSNIGCNSYLYNGSLFVFGVQTGAADHHITVMKFPMPALSDGSEVTLDMDNRQEISAGEYSKTFSVPNAMQGGFVMNGILYCCYNVGGIFALDLSDGTYLGSFSMYTAIPHEPETCFMWNGDLYVLAMNRTNEVSDSVVGQIYYVELLTV